ncbi:hypothetical protein ABEB36_003110 [Hypothenemus hampei]|uniref:RRM domain-containing protein n=1 Tax=Hypothenemus hampei TaxID=57062 RepID=A0ABD1FAP1_HYPHA
MNYLTNVKNITKLSEQELYSSGRTSWHDQYRDSAWIYVGGLPFDLTEGDIICIFSQYGEVVNINLIRAKDTGKSKGFCFLCYEDQRSTILAVDNFNGIKIMNRTIRVDHVQNYKVPKDDKKATAETKQLHTEGCAPKPIPIKSVVKSELANMYVRETLADQIEHDIKLPVRLPIYQHIKEENVSHTEGETIKKDEKLNSKPTDVDKESLSDKSNSKKKKLKEKDDDDVDNIKKSNKKKKKQKDSSKEKDTTSKADDNETDPKPKVFKRDVSPNIPKRWR